MHRTLIPVFPVPGTRLFELLFAGLALAFVLSLGASPYPADALLKVSPILCLLVAVFRVPNGIGRRWILGALVFCGCGDVLLELGHFVPGLGAFLLGHLCYLGAFCRRLRFGALNLAIVAALLVCAVAYFRFLLPHLGELRLAVGVYLLVIVSMAASAVLGADNHKLVVLGALLFVISDAMIAYNRFVEPLHGVRYWIMSSYYLAQFFLTRDARASTEGSYR